MKLELVKYIPGKLNQGVLYVSFDFNTVNQLCACGCGLEVVTPISPNSWRVTYNGVAISLYPSIGNWQFPCRSHYWIIENEVVWAEDWLTEEDDEQFWKKSLNKNNPQEGSKNSFIAWLKRIMQ